MRGSFESHDLELVRPLDPDELPGFVGSEREWEEPQPTDGTEGVVYNRDDFAEMYDEVPVAVVGIVPTFASAENGAIGVGDLLVTANTPGHAMRDADPKAGTILGKALEPLDRELDMTEELGDMTIRGILDRMEESDDGLVITDYKTGKAPPAQYAIPAFFALKIYALLIRKRTGRTPARLKLMYLNGPTVYEIPVNDLQLDATQRKLEALWAAINQAIVDNNFPPRPGKLCGWCQFRDRCPAFAAELDDTAVAS